MKRLFLLKILTLLILIPLTACSSSGAQPSGGAQQNTVPTPTIEEKVYHTCDISFSEDKAGEIPLESSEFIVDTDIYVTVVFSFFNLDDVEDVIEFKVNLAPGFDTYSVVDYTEGPQKPKDAPTEFDFIESDHKIKVIAITGMQFPIHAGVQKKSYKYVFTLKASKPSDDCYFKAVFSAQYGEFSKSKPNWAEQEKFTIVENNQEDPAE